MEMSGKHEKSPKIGCYVLAFETVAQPQHSNIVHNTSLVEKQELNTASHLAEICPTSSPHQQPSPPI